MKYSEVQKFKTRLENLGGRYWGKRGNKRVYFSPAKAFEIAGGGYTNHSTTGEGWLPELGTFGPFDREHLETVFFDFRDDTWKSIGSADVSELIAALTTEFGVYPNPKAYDEYESDEKEALALAAHEEREALSRRHNVFDTRSIAKSALYVAYHQTKFKTSTELSLSDNGVITVSWTDGPSLEEVAAVVRPYIGTTRIFTDGKREKVEVPVESKDGKPHFYDVSTFNLYRSESAVGTTHRSSVKVSLANGVETVISPPQLLPETPPKPLSQAALKRAAVQARAKALQDAFDLAASEDASREEYASLADHENSRVREALAKNPRVGADILADIARNSQHVRVAIASNLNTPLEVLRTLMTDSFTSVRIAVFHNPNITPEMLDAFGMDLSPVIAIEMMQSGNVNPVHWAIWADHYKIDVRSFLARFPSAPLHIIHWMALNERNKYIKRAAQALYEERVAQGESLSE